MRVWLSSQGWESNYMISVLWTDFLPWFRRKSFKQVFAKLILKDNYLEPSNSFQNVNPIQNCYTEKESFQLIAARLGTQYSWNRFLSDVIFFASNSISTNSKIAADSPNLATERLDPGGSDHENFLDQIGCSWKFPEIFDDGARLR